MAFDTTDILIIVIVVVLLFGASQIPKIARSLGRAQGEFSKARTEFQTEMARGEKGAHALPTPAEEERRIRAAARDLGIPEEGKPLDEVKRLMNERLG